MGKIIALSVLVILVIASVPMPGFTQAQAGGSGSRQVCQAFEGICTQIQPPNLPPAPGDWKMTRTPEGKPDFTGVYAGAGFTHQVGRNETDANLFRGFDSKSMAPLVPGGEKILFIPTTGRLEIDDPIALCLPYGFTGQIFSPYAQQWIQSDKWLFIRHEFMNNFSRTIALDGRPHPKDPDLTWGGHSVGRWEGDTLVIDTIGLKRWWLDFPHPKGSLWHSDKMHVIERVRWTAPRVVSYDVTIDDPEIWTKPWTEHFDMVLHPTWELLEFVCNENDRCGAGNCTPSDAQK